MSDNQSPIEQWQGYKKAAYSESPLVPEQEKECSECFYAGMMAGLTSGLVLISEYKGARRVKEVKKLMNQIKFVALSNNPTGRN